MHVSAHAWAGDVTPSALESTLATKSTQATSTPCFQPTRNHLHLGIHRALGKIRNASFRTKCLYVVFALWVKGSFHVHIHICIHTCTHTHTHYIYIYIYIYIWYTNTHGMCISPEAYFSVCCCMYILIYTYYIYIIHTYAENQNIGHRCNNMLMQVPLYVCRLVCSCSSSCIRHVHVCTGACTKAKIQDIHTHTHTRARARAHTHTHAHIPVETYPNKPSDTHVDSFQEKDWEQKQKRHCFAVRKAAEICTDRFEHE